MKSEESEREPTRKSSTKDHDNSMTNKQKVCIRTRKKTGSQEERYVIQFKKLCPKSKCSEKNLQNTQKDGLSTIFEENSSRPSSIYSTYQAEYTHSQEDTARTEIDLSDVENSILPHIENCLDKENKSNFDCITTIEMPIKRNNCLNRYIIEMEKNRTAKKGTGLLDDSTNLPTTYGEIRTDSSDKNKQNERGAYGRKYIVEFREPCPEQKDCHTERITRISPVTTNERKRINSSEDIYSDNDASNKVLSTFKDKQKTMTDGQFASSTFVGDLEIQKCCYGEKGSQSTCIRTIKKRGSTGRNYVIQFREACFSREASVTKVPNEEVNVESESAIINTLNDNDKINGNRKTENVQTYTTREDNSFDSSSSGDNHRNRKSRRRRHSHRTCNKGTCPAHRGHSHTSRMAVAPNINIDWKTSLKKYVKGMKEHVSDFFEEKFFNGLVFDFGDYLSKKFEEYNKHNIILELVKYLNIYKMVC